MSGLIYRCINLKTQEVYIGQTTVGLDNRKAKHIADSKRGSMLKLHKAIMKYGEENFIWEILEDDILKGSLLKYESKYIIDNNSIKCGYNVSQQNRGKH